VTHRSPAQRFGLPSPMQCCRNRRKSLSFRYLCPDFVPRRGTGNTVRKASLNQISPRYFHAQSLRIRHNFGWCVRSRSLARASRLYALLTMRRKPHSADRQGKQITSGAR
jgi:hypothetical protein